jgi:hypothetical protein
VVIGALHRGAAQIFTQFRKGNVPKRLDRLIKVDLP